MLRHELSIRRRQVARPRFEPHDRVVLSALSRLQRRHGWSAFLVRPDTLLHWHRRLIARRSTHLYRKPVWGGKTMFIRLVRSICRQKRGWAQAAREAATAVPAAG